jgi:hypothetical protein
MVDEHFARGKRSLARCNFNREARRRAACALLGLRGGMPNWLPGMVQQLWPWSEPIRMESPPRACLVRAGALIVAEIAQIDRKRGLG